MITAAEVRCLCSETVEYKVEKLSSTIKKLAKENRCCLRTGLDYEEDMDLWENDCKYIESREWKAAKRILENHGYRVSFYYNNKRDALCTLIDW